MKTIIATGRVTKDAELINRNGVDIVNFNLAVNTRKATAQKDEAGKRIYAQITEYYRVTIWRDYAKAMAPHLTKGRLLQVCSNDFVPETWVDRDNQIHPIIHIDSPTIDFLDGAKKKEAEPPTDETATPVEDDAAPFGD